MLTLFAQYPSSYFILSHPLTLVHLLSCHSLFLILSLSSSFSHHSSTLILKLSSSFLIIPHSSLFILKFSFFFSHLSTLLILLTLILVSSFLLSHSLIVFILSHHSSFLILSLIQFCPNFSFINVRTGTFLLFIALEKMLLSRYLLFLENN